MADAGCALSVLWTLVETFPFYEHAGYHPVVFQNEAVTLARPDADAFARDPGIDGRHAGRDGQPPPSTPSEACMTRTPAARGSGATPARARALFALPRMRTLVARRGGVPVGYLVVSEAINKPGLIEAGGEPTAVATLVQAALSGLADGVTFDAPSLRAPTVLAEVVEQAVPGRRRAVTDGMMVRVNDIDALLGRPAPLELSHRAWAAALFGSHPARPTPPIPGLADRLGLPLPLSLPIPVLDRS